MVDPTNPIIPPVDEPAIWTGGGRVSGAGFRLSPKAQARKMFQETRRPGDSESEWMRQFEEVFRELLSEQISGVFEQDAEAAQGYIFRDTAAGHTSGKYNRYTAAMERAAEEARRRLHGQPGWVGRYPRDPFLMLKVGETVDFFLCWKCGCYAILLQRALCPVCLTEMGEQY